MKKKRDYLNIISTVIAVIAFVIVLVNQLFMGGMSFRLETSPVVDVSTGWTNVLSGELEERESVRVLPGAKLELSRTLPNDLNDDKVLGYYDYGFRVIAYVDNEEIYSSGAETAGKFGTQSGQGWKMIPLNEQDAAKTLLIIFENDTDSTLRLNMTRMQITYASTEIVRGFISSWAALAITVFCLIMTVLLVIFSFLLRRYGFMEHFHLMLLLASAGLTVAVWTWANSSLCQMITTNLTLSYRLGHLTYFLIPMFLGLFYERLLKKETRVFHLINLSYRVVLVAVFILCMTGEVPLAQSAFMAHVYLFTELLMGSYYGIRTFLADRSRLKHWSMIGQMVFLLVSVVFIPLYYIQGEENVFLYAGFAFSAFLFTMALAQAVYIQRDLTAHRMNMEFRNRSKKDPVTGGNSRLGISYQIEEIDFTGIESPWFLTMELVNFPGINALFGWKSGAKMIRGVYETNQAALEEGDYQATVGEAEFAFLLPAEKNIEDLCRRLGEGLQQYMKENWLNTFMSPRFCATRVNPGNDLNKLLSCTCLGYTGRDPLGVRSTLVYYFDMRCRDRVLKGQVVENEVSRALQNEKMNLLITPVYDVQTGKICQADTTLVWNVKAERDQVEFEFIPKTEKDILGLRMNIDHAKKVMECLAKYPQLGNIRVSLRISKDCLTNRIFWTAFHEAQVEAGVDLSRLDLELPLELDDNNIDALHEVVDRLHEKGAVISIRKFDGSLQIIQLAKELQVDWVKFDRRLLIEAKSSNEELFDQVGHLVRVLHGQGQKVCICGVTDPEEVERLRSIGADRMRGKALHMSVLEDVFVKLVEEKGEAL